MAVPGLRRTVDTTFQKVLDHTLGSAIDTGTGADATVLAALMAASDYLPIAATYQFEPTGMLSADFDEDGDDFLVWQRNFPYPAALSSVPEPNSLALLTLGATGVLAYRRRRIQRGW